MISFVILCFTNNLLLTRQNLVNNMDNTLLILLLISAIFGGCYAEPRKDCGGKAADIVFVLDSSSSIWPPDYIRQLRFVQNLSSEFDIGRGEAQTRIGVITFSDTHKLHFNLNENFDKMAVMSAIKKTPYTSGGTNTADALQYLQQSMFSEMNGGRSSSSHIAVVITDGQSHDPNATLLAANKAKSQGIQIFAIGVGAGADEDELKSIASTPSDKFVFKVFSYKALNDIHTSLSHRACEVTKAPSTPHTTPVAITTKQTTEGATPKSVIKDDERIMKACGGKPADVFFLMDSSSSIELPQYTKQKLFVSNIVNLFDIGTNKTRVGLSTFSYQYRPYISLDQYNSKSDLIAAISRSPYLSGGTNTGDAIKNVRETGFGGAFARHEVGHILIILTDGLSNIPEKTKMEARKAKEDGIYIFAIGIGDNVDAKELKDIASDPDDEFLFQVGSFDALESIRDILAIRTCETPSADQSGSGRCSITQDTDILFTFDSTRSGAILSKTILRFIGEVSMTFESKSSYVRTSLLSTNCPTSGDIPFTPEINTEITSFLKSDSAELSSLLRRMRLDGFSAHSGGRTAARHVSVMFIDETLDNQSFMEAQRARFQNIDLFIVVIGDKVDLDRIQLLCGGGLHLLVVPSYNHLVSMAKTFSSNMCQELSQKTSRVREMKLL